MPPTESVENRDPDAAPMQNEMQQQITHLLSRAKANDATLCDIIDHILRDTAWNDEELVLRLRDAQAEMRN